MRAKVIPLLTIELKTENVLKEMGYSAEFQKKLPEGRARQVQFLIEKSRTIIQPQGVYKVFSCKVKGNKIILDKKIEFQSEFLARNFKKTQELALFVVTIGDGLIKEIQEFDKQRKFMESWILECIGTEATEQAANQIQEIIKEKRNWQGKVVRYSPGYNEGNLTAPQDWLLKDQWIIFKALPVKKIEVQLTSAGMMMPRKSISAITGLREKDR